MSAGVNPVYTSGFTPGLTIDQGQVPLYEGPVGVPGMKMGGRRKKGAKGMGILDNIKKGINWAKENKIISKGADAVGNIAKKQGFGKNGRFNVPKQGPNGFAVDNIGVGPTMKGNKPINGGAKAKDNMLIVPNVGDKAMHGGYGGVVGSTKKGSYLQDQRYGLKMGGRKKKIIEM
jgi:hypothetical protein